MDEVKKHEKQSIRDWFNTIILCVSAVKNRVEDFEFEIPENLINGKNHVIVVITNCRSDSNSRIMQNARAIRARIKETGLEDDDIIYVSSYEKTFPTGEKTEQFGKEEILKQIIRNLWRNFTITFPYEMKKKTENIFDKKYYEMIAKAKLFSRTTRFRLPHEIKEFECKFNDDFKKDVSDIIKDVNQDFEDAYEYYSLLSKQYCHELYINKEEIYKNPDMDFKVHKGFDKKIDELIKT